MLRLCAGWIRTEAAGGAVPRSQGHGYVSTSLVDPRTSQLNHIVATPIGVRTRADFQAAIDEKARSGLWMLYFGIGATAAGLAIVLGHELWRGGALPVLR